MDMARIPKGAYVLDVGVGTGDIALEVLRRDCTRCVIIVDVTREIDDEGRVKSTERCTS